MRKLRIDRFMKKNLNVLIRLKIMEKTGYILTRDKHRLFYRMVAPEKFSRTLLALHGGPGVSHDYLLPLSELATPRNSLRVVFYDQLGCGRSDHARDKTLYNMQSFREHVEDLRQELGLGRIMLLGQSMGGCISLEYVLKYPENVEKLILSNSGANIPDIVRHMQRLKKGLPPEVLSVLEKYEEVEDYTNPEYQKAMEMMYRRHVIRKDSYPKIVEEAFNNLNMEVYGAFWGPNEFICTGNVRDWNIMDRISEIKAPTLIILGKYDEIPTEHADAMEKLMKNSRVVILEKSSHMNMWEDESEKYLQAIEDFIKTG